MSLIRTVVLVATAIMLLPMDDHQPNKQGTKSASEAPAGFCERNPSTCAASRELLAELIRKSELALALGSQLLKEHMKANQQVSASDATAPRDSTRLVLQPRIEPMVPPLQRDATMHDRRTTYSMDYPRWR